MIRIPMIGHGIGGRLDLPVPITFFVAGAAVVLIVSFVALAALWPQPRLQSGPRMAAGREVTLGPLRWVGIGGLVLAVLGGLAALITGQETVGNRNISPVLLWVGFWLVIPFVSVLLGNLYTGVNPWRTMSGWLDIGEGERPDVGRRLGVWPATFGLVVFAWMELINPEGGEAATVGLAALVYTVVLLVLIGRFGRETALGSFDIFTTYNRLLSSIAPWGRNSSGRLVRRGWLRALPVVPQWPGLAALLAVMIGTVSFDGFSNTSSYETLTGSFGAAIGGKTLLLIGACLLIGGAYYSACVVAARVGGGGADGGAVAGRFAHALVPIAFAYAFAHYFTLVLFEGQGVISAASDPFGLGWDLFGTRDYKINFFLGAVAVWYIQVAVLVAGHVAGVILAHDRALADFKGTGAVRSQYAMLLLMVLLTGLGLFILAG